VRLILRPRVSTVVLAPVGAPEITLRTSPLRVVELDVGGRGPQGPAGAFGATLSKVAGAALGGHRVVVASGADEVLVADVTDPAHLHRVLGITEGAAVLGDGIDVRFAGEMTEASWSWTPGAPIYVGASGVLTQTPPVGAAWLRIVAVAVSATRIVVGLREPVRLS
jgi:hypothetical protein